ncbi:MAG TPA: M23 family metallopeptidase, partial [Bacteroidetes bacterium]|nr:M23 family metallopeptidase [Bacteroidota bacterium]
LTSSFGEYRPGHFHAGLDIKTWGKEGYRVFATRDGYIYRVRISPFGYGKVIYQKLDTGEIAVYAHLQRFAPGLEAIMRREQRRRQRYSVTKTFAPGALPVKKGEVIAYTGRTGIGYPHLHFEIRETEDTPINPLLKGFVLKDDVPPVARQIAVLPLEYGSQADGSQMPAVYDLEPVHQHLYTLPRPVQVWGVAGLAVSAFDRANGVNNRFSIYRAIFYLDDREIFRSTFKKFSYSQTQQILLDRNYRLLVSSGRKFYNLYIEPENTLPFYEPHRVFQGSIYTKGFADSLAARTDYLSWLASLPSPLENFEERFLARFGSSPLPVAPGRHQVRIILEDFWGNRAFVEFPLIAGPKVPPPEQWLAPAEAGMLKSRAAEGKWLRKRGGTWHPVLPPGFFETEGSNGTGDPFLGWLHSLAAPLQFVPESTWGVPGFPYFIVPGALPAEPPKLEPRLSVWDALTTVRFQSDQSVLFPLQLQISNRRLGSRTVPLLALDDRTLEADFPSFDLANDSTSLVVREKGTGKVLFQRKIFLHYIPKDRGGSCTAPGGIASLQLPMRASNRDIYLSFEPVPRRQLQANPPGDSLSPVYQIDLLEVPLLRAALLKFHLPPSVPRMRQVGVYEASSSRKPWKFSGNSIAKDGHTIFAQIHGPGRFLLLRDEKPPVIRFLSPRPGQTLAASRPEVRIRYDDDLSGVGDERDFRLTLDGRFCITEMDPEMKILRYRPDWRLRAGKHKLTLWIRDRAGNERTRSISFYVKGKP